MGTVLETDEAIARSPGHNSYLYLPDSDQLLYLSIIGGNTWMPVPMPAVYAWIKWF